MSKPIDLIGKKFGRLTVVERLENNSRGGTVWKCRCDCGNTKIADGERLRIGKVKSCGCLVLEVSATNYYKHGMTHTRIHNIWKTMKHRCECDGISNYSDYGGRGITICDEWTGENGFQNFYDWSMKNGYADNLSIDRIDNDKGYSPDNCRWTTQKVQANNKRSSLLVLYKGKKITVKELSEMTGKKYSFLRNHFHRGDLENVLNGVSYFADDEVEV